MPDMAKLDPAVRAFLEETRFAVLATVAPDGLPQQTVMWYLIDGDDLLFNTKRGRVKDRNLGRDRRVSLCIEDGYRYVTIRGEAREVADQPTAQADIKRLAVRYHGPAKGAQMAQNGFRNEERVTYRVKLDDISTRGFET